MENARELFQVLIRRLGILNKNCCGVEGVDVSVVQSHILYEVGRRHEPSMQQVAETLGMDITTFSRQVQSLMEAGLLKKVPYPEDRRINILSLTEQGKRSAARIDEIMTDYFAEIFSHMTEFERETVMRSIRLLNESMAKSHRCCGSAG